MQHLSYSSINLYLTCPEHWRRKYLLQQPQPSTPALVIGSAVHGTIEESLVSRQPLAQLWPGVWATKLERDAASIEWGADTPEQHFNDGLRLMSDPAVQQLVDGLTPLVDAAGVFIERKVELRVPGVPLPVIGYIDLMTADGVPGDFKTSRNRWTQGDAEGEIQPLVYLAALHQAGQPVAGNRFRHYVITKTKKPEVQVIEHRHTMTEIFWLFELIRRVWRGIEAEVFPVNPNAWLCSSRYCAYWTQCRGRKDK